MIACVDTHYTEDSSRTGVVIIQEWHDDHIEAESVCERHQEPADYVPGEFFRRELPCILEAIDPFRDSISIVVVDGYVQLGDGQAGLGLKLYESLDSIAVVGVAKNPFQGASDAVPVFRGSSRRPLFVSAAGMETQEAATAVAGMHGEFRIPTILKHADQLARGH